MVVQALLPKGLTMRFLNLYFIQITSRYGEHSILRILVTGGTGFIGKPLCDGLLSDRHDLVVLSRNPAKATALFDGKIQAIECIDHVDKNESFDAIINLAGEGVADKRWTVKRKQLLYDSRISTTRDLIRYIERACNKPDVLISGSACGFYGDSGGKAVTESDVGQPGFTHRLCSDWELVALEAQSMGVRVCLIRTALVFHPSGGALKKMLLPFRLGLGGHFGSGTQWLPWIHRDDEVAVIRFALACENISGPVNAVAPGAVTNAEFTRTLAKAIHRPALLTTPEISLKLLLGEQSHLLLDSVHMLPEKLMDNGFEFTYGSLESALNCLS